MIRAHLLHRHTFGQLKLLRRCFDALNGLREGQPRILKLLVCRLHLGAKASVFEVVRLGGRLFVLITLLNLFRSLPLICGEALVDVARRLAGGGRHRAVCLTVGQAQLVSRGRVHIRLPGRLVLLHSLLSAGPLQLTWLVVHQLDPVA